MHPGQCNEMCNTKLQTKKAQSAIRTKNSLYTHEGTSDSMGALPMTLQPGLKTQNEIRLSSLCPSFCKFGMQANLSIGGGPHMTVIVLSEEGQRWSASIF